MLRIQSRLLGWGKLEDKLFKTFGGSTAKRYIVCGLNVLIAAKRWYVRRSRHGHVVFPQRAKYC